MPVPVGDIWFLSGALSTLLVVLIGIAWIAGLFDLAFKRSDIDWTKRAAWMLLIVLLPIIGTVIYFAVRPTLSDEAEKIIASRTGRPY